MLKRTLGFATLFTKQTVGYFSILLLIIIASFALRLYGLNRILADWHSFRQVDTASVTREYIKRGIDPLRPRYHDVSNIASGSFNPEGWRMVEFPLLNITVAMLLTAKPDLPLVATHRMVSVVASIMSLLAIAWITKQWYGRITSLLAAGIFGLMPFNIYFSRVILPEPFMVMWGLLGIATFTVWAKNTADRYDLGESRIINWNDAWLILGGVLFAVALMVKPVAVFFLPLYVFSLWRWRRWNKAAIVKVGGVLLISVVPLVWWRTWIQQFPEGIPASDWLLNGNNIRFRPAWWRWLFADRVGRMMFGHWGAATLILGTLAAFWEFPRKRLAKQSLLQWVTTEIDAVAQREGLALGSIALIIGFFIIFATGNVQHDYYQTLVIPGVAIVSARGVVWLLRRSATLWQLLWLSAATAVLAVFSFGFAWYDIETLFSIQNPAIQAAGSAVQRLTPPDSLVIAHYMGDTTLLFATDRRGWAIGYNIEEKRAQGAEFFLTTANDDATREVTARYPVIEETDLYILVDLRTPLATPAGEIN